MGKNNSFKTNHAVSEIVGGLFLVVIAVVAFASIYMYLYPPGPDLKTPVKIEGYVSDEGRVILAHKGGDTLSNYKVLIRETTGELIGSKTINGDQWKIGSYRYPLEQLELYDTRLTDETMSLDIALYCQNKDGSFEEVFHGILTGKPEGTTTDTEEIEDPMLISTLKTKSCEEDLICFNDTIEAPDATSFIYNWLVGNNPIYYVLYPFDLNDNNLVKDYSCNETSSECNFNGDIKGATWNETGIIGGCYQFDGNDYIELPYCCDKSGFIDEITIETWINTNSQNGMISSFEDNKYWRLFLDEGKVKWHTNGSDGSNEISSISSVSDGTWHHIAVTYDDNDGKCIMYIDGEEENQAQSHATSTLLGDGSKPNATIGYGGKVGSESSWQTLTYDDFEDGWGNYTDGGRDCGIVDWYKHQGDYSAIIRNKCWDEEETDTSFYLTNGIDITGYTSIKLDFWWMWNDYYLWGSWGWSNGEDWWVKYWDGNEWQMILDRNYPSGFEEDIWHHEILYINKSDYNFPNDMKIMFRCDASWINDRVFFDQIYINATTGSKFYENYTGKIDEFKIYNRSLTPEQINQNYLCTKDGFSDRSVIVSEETVIGNIWSCIVTPNKSSMDYSTTLSDTLQIIKYSKGG